MAKELPYFEFEPAEWQSGNIQITSLACKGLFIELCCLYWQRLGDLPYALALHKLCNGDATLLQELSSQNIITEKDGQIYIAFLSEQLSKFEGISEKRRKAANERWKNAKDMQVHSKSNAIREEKRIEENRIEDKSKEKKESKKKNFTPPQLNEVFDYFLQKTGKEEFSAQESEKFIDHYTNKNWRIGSSRTQMKDWRAAVRNWLKNDFTKNGKKERLSEDQQLYLANRRDI